MALLTSSFYLSDHTLQQVVDQFLKLEFLTIKNQWVNLKIQGSQNH